MSAQDEVIRRLNFLARETIDWDTVYREEFPRVYNFFRYRFGDGPRAEDLTSTTFERAWAKRGRYRHDRAAFSTWLFSIARNLAIDAYRRHRHTISLEDVELEAGLPAVEQQIQEQQDYFRLEQLLAQLPERERELVALKYGADLTNREIARLTGLSETNVGSILHRVVNKLRKQWEVTYG
jgi:RNA polymerase sigma-70 factor, ECF subfamily